MAINKHSIIKSFSIRSSNQNYLSKISKYFLHPYFLSAYSEHRIEIGFGNGDYIATQAIENPHIHFIGAEVYPKGISSLAKKIEQLKLKNISIYPQDVRFLFLDMPNSLISRIIILFPDPWPKKRHHKRRLMGTQFLQMIKNKFTDKLLIATDSSDYAKYIVEVAKQTNYSTQTVEDISTIIGSIKTKYQEKTSDRKPKCVIISKIC